MATCRSGREAPASPPPRPAQARPRPAPLVQQGYRLPMPAARTSVANAHERTPARYRPGRTDCIKAIQKLTLSQQRQGASSRPCPELHRGSPSMVCPASPHTASGYMAFLNIIVRMLTSIKAYFSLHSAAQNNSAKSTLAPRISHVGFSVLWIKLKTKCAKISNRLDKCVGFLPRRRKSLVQLLC